MRAKITKEGNGVTLSYDHPADESSRINRTFIVSRSHVLEDRGSRGWERVCFGLTKLGNVLTCHDSSDLLSIIRREYRAMRRADSRASSY